MQQRWVSLVEAAALEAAEGRPLSKPTVCRYLKRHPEIPVQRSRNGAVVRKLDYAAFRAHRLSNINVADAHPAAMAPAEPAGAFFTPNPLPLLPGAQIAPSAPATAAARKTEAQAQKVELELAERTGRLVGRQAASRAVQELGAAFSAALDKLERRLATRVVGVEDERAAQTVIRGECRSLRAELAEQVRRASGLSSADAVTA